MADKNIYPDISGEIQDKINKLAQRIYDLDTAVYSEVGSSLGRTFTGDRDKCINDLVRLIVTNPQGYLLRSEISLVGNMARTITNKEAKSRLMTEYNIILHELRNVPLVFGSVDIMDENLAQLNTSNLGKGFSPDDHLIICISRTEGSAGTDIGFALADELRINYYDAEVIKDVLHKIDEDKDKHWQSKKLALMSAKARDFSRYHGLSKADAAFFNESEMLTQIAKEQDFIIVGRCADTILENNNIPHISVFITAPFQQRAKRIMELEKIPYRKALKRLKKLDKKREKYYKYYTGKQWGNATNYDLCINSARYGIKEATDLILRIINREAFDNDNLPE